MVENSVCANNSLVSEDKNVSERKFDTILLGKKTLDESTIDVRESIAEYNDSGFVGCEPRLFRFNKKFCRIAVDDNGLCYIQALDTVALMKNELMQVCSWKKFDYKSGNSYPCDPPRSIVENLMSCAEYNIIAPTIVGTTDVPLLDEDGNIKKNTGYDPATRLYYTGEIKIDLPENPTEEQIREAVEFLHEPFVDFPFSDEASRTNAMAALVTAIIRPFIIGNVPIFATTKTNVGEGASLMTQVISKLAYGCDAKPIQWSSEEEEIRKKLSASLLSTSKMVFFDNIKVNGPVQSSSLASFVTAPIWKDRNLGTLNSIELPNTAVTFMNGIGLSFSSDLTRRVVLCKLQSDSATPWKEKRNFRHADIIRWADLYRIRMIESVYTLLRTWIVRGRPHLQAIKEPLGNFEQWSEIVGGILGIAGRTDLLDGMEDVIIDGEVEQWANFVEALFDLFKDKPFTVGRLQEHLKAEERIGNVDGQIINTLPDILSDAFSGHKNFSRACGNQFAYYAGRNLGKGHKLMKAGVAHHAIQWQVAVATTLQTT